MNKGKFAVFFTSLYLLIFLLAVALGQVKLAFTMFLFSPILVISMVYSVIRYGKFSGRELGTDEWGYEDKRKEDLGVF